jgi:2-dehydropantoate 2-reductase
VTQNILMVGAGAVGQVFALHLSRGGAAITFLVKPTHALPAELRLFAQAKHPTTLTGFRRMTQPEEVRREKWDQVWLAVPSDALIGQWLPDLLNATGDATVVGLAPESNTHVPPARLVMGAIPFLAFQQPLPGGSGDPGLAFWIPPLAAIPLSGSTERVQPVVQSLRAGGLSARRVSDAAVQPRSERQ